jgi:hypothetical protein
MKLLWKELKLRDGKYLKRLKVGLKITDSRIVFQASPFSKLLNAKIKTMAGWKWDPDNKKWSIENCPRNVFQLSYLWGDDVYAWFKRPLIETPVFDRPEFERLNVEIAPQQVNMVRRGLTYHYQLFAAEQGLGKSLAALEIMERSDKKRWWYVGPRSAMESVLREFDKWGLDPTVKVNFMSYEGLVKDIRYNDTDPPEGIILDEISYAKNPTAHRAKACQTIADRIREKHGLDGYVIGLSGTPTAKSPLDCWKPLEIVWPGYMAEGEWKAFQQRYAVVEQQQDMDGVTFTKQVGWREDEIAKLPKRYDGLMPVYRVADWLSLPNKTFHQIELEPSKKLLRVAAMLTEIAPNAISAITWLRALSSGFQYKMVQNGTEKCDLCNQAGMFTHIPGHDPVVCPHCHGEKEVPKFERTTKMVKTPKDKALRDILDKCEPEGRVVVSASFQGSIDRCLAICRQRGWAVAAVDGRGWRAFDNQGGLLKATKPLDLWENHDGKVAFVGNPGSCGYGLTLTLANTMVFYDNDYSAEKRLQMIARVWRMSQKRTAFIYDLVHLPVDRLVIGTLSENKNLELLSLGLIQECFADVDPGEDELEEETIL